jgi:succinate dehydrogenase hydrophobic anchor subunit
MALLLMLLHDWFGLETIVDKHTHSHTKKETVDELAI